MSRPHRIIIHTFLLAALPGCALLSRLGTDPAGAAYGRIYFVGGAGGVGNVVGTWDVPRGLREAGYRGSIEVFAWQSPIGDAVVDQFARGRNQQEARRLAARIRAYQQEYPGRRVHLIAISAGTGIVAWALEGLPPDTPVGTVVFLSSSLSGEYDLTDVLQRAHGMLYHFYSPADPLLRFGLPITGTVDRELGFERAAGLIGFRLPPGADEHTEALYVERLRNQPHRAEYTPYGYFGGHADSTAPRFIAHFVAPLLRAGDSPHAWVPYDEDEYGR